jgi:hypothetical protein
MSSLSLGLFTLAAVLCLSPFTPKIRAPWLWGLCCAATLLFFILDPVPFVHLLLWSMAGVMLCVFDRNATVDGFIKATLTGYLLGAAAVAVPHVTVDFFTLDPTVFLIGVCLLAILAGYQQSRWHGVSAVVISGALALAQFDGVPSEDVVINDSRLSVSSEQPRATSIDLDLGDFI